MRLRSAIAASVVALSLLAACGGDDGGSKADGAGSRSTSSTGKAFDKTSDRITDVDDTTDSAGGSCTADSGDADALEALLPPAPAGYTEEADDVGDTGPSDLDKAIADDGEDDAEQVLTDARFTAGYQRLWTKGDVELIAFVYQFCDPAGAEAYLARTLGFNDDEAVDEFDVAGVEGAYGASLTEEGYAAAQVVVVEGRYLLQTVSGAPEADVAMAEHQARATELAKALAERAADA